MNQAATVTETQLNSNDQLFDINVPEHEDLAVRYMNAKAVLLVTSFGYEVENADQAWAIIRTHNLIERMKNATAPTQIQ